MANTRNPQEHVETRGSSIDDTLTPTDHDANAIDLADTLDYALSQIADITGETAWEDPPDLSIAAIVAKTFLDEKLALRWVQLLTDITVPGSQNWKILSVASNELPPANKTKAINANTEGLVTAQATTFGAHNLDEVTGQNPLSPKNLLLVWDGDTGDPIESAGRQVYALLQHESGATDGTDFTDTTPQRAQVSFVRPNATYDDLEAVPVVDIENQKTNLSFADRRNLDSWTEQDFLSGIRHIDLGVAGSATTLDNAIDNQGATPATQATDISIRIDDTKKWAFQDPSGANDILAAIAASGADEVEINADIFDVNVGGAGTIDFDNGATVDSGGTPINLGVTPGQIDSGASALSLVSTGAAVTVNGAGVNINGNAAEIDLTTSAAVDINATAAGATIDSADDSNFTMAANDAAAKQLLIAARNAGAGDGDLKLEADDDILFETAQETTGIALDDATTGAISGLFGQSFTSVAEAIKFAGDTAGDQLAMKLTVLGSGFAQGVNIPAATLDLTVYTLNMSGNAATVFVFYNGRLLRGASAASIGDVYPGTTPANGDLKHDFSKPFKTNDVLISIGLA